MAKADEMRGAFTSILKEMYPDDPLGLHQLVAAILYQEVAIASAESFLREKPNDVSEIHRQT